MSAPASPSPADRFALIIAGLCRAVAARGARERSGGPLCALVWSWLRRLAVRVGALATRLQAGTQAAAAPARSPASPRLPAAPRARPPRPPRRLPRGFAWLVRLVPEAAPAASQLQYLLAEPEMAALIAACPQIGRMLRPLCRMLGVRLPPGLRAPPPGQPAPPAASAAGHAPPPAAPGDRPPRSPPPAMAPDRAHHLPAPA